MIAVSIRNFELLVTEREQNMNELMEILNGLHDDVDFAHETGLVENGVLNSLDIVTLITEIADRFDVQIPAEEIVPENFDSAEAIWALIEKLDEA